MKWLTIGLLACASLALAQEPGPPPPTEAELAAAVHRFIDADASAEVCRPPTLHGNELHYECATIECPGECQVVRHTTVLAFRSGHFRRLSEHREDRGDTGQCGCCLEQTL